MISAALCSLVSGLLALLLYHRLYSPFFWQDLLFYLKLRSFARTVRARVQRGVVSYLDCFLLQVRKTPAKPFIIFEDRTLSYLDVDRRSSQFAGAFGTADLKRGDVVALLMSNEPDFVCAWLGLCKLGCEVAFLNVNVKTRSLLHCVRTCGARSLVVGADLVHVVQEVLADLKEDGLSLWLVDHTSPSEDLKTLLDKLDNMSTETAGPVPAVDLMSPFLMIFTSGTTGLPKAARVGHLKAIGSMGFFDLCGATSDDIIYITLPLYHMSASLLGIGGCIHLGATCVLKKKFSASQFWKDCVKHNVTVVQYIGELCRYLLNHPVLSTPFQLLKYDPETYDVVRTNSGRCVPAQAGEAGILVTPLTAGNQFLGYVGNKVQSEKKLLRDVMQAGDVFFNTGDLLLRDRRDFLYFRDRIGDTFRWKGENVSTTEVSETLGLLHFIQEVNVYGVSVPGYEGRAGMAAIVLKQGVKLDGKKLFSHLQETLPTYAWPWFLRIQTSLDVTETFKQQKLKLVQEGFHPHTADDPLYFLDTSQRDVVLLTAAVYQDIVSGRTSL